MIDVTILTDARYVAIPAPNAYERNVLLEDELVQKALEKNGFKVARVAWDDPKVNWHKTKTALFRTTWDYFDKYRDFLKWMGSVSQETKLINPISIVEWNRDKHYLLELEKAGIPIPPTTIIKRGSKSSLQEIVEKLPWNNLILKPTIAGAARHTYKILNKNCTSVEAIFKELIAQEDMMLQEFQHQITEKGEVSLILIDGKYTHAILKKSKRNDFRVQDDFGGTVHHYEPDKALLQMAQKCMDFLPQMPLYARVDVMFDNSGSYVLSELELIEPELWFRFHPEAATLLAKAIHKYI